jgi:hypothetical protein
VHGRLNVAGYGQDYLRRLGGAGGPRDNAAAVLAARGGPPDAQDARLAEVAGMTGGPTGAYSYPAVASRGDVQSDAPPIGITGGPGPAIGNAVTDTIQSRMQPPPAQGVPQPNPTLAGSTTPATGGLPGSVKVAQAAANNPPIVTDAITPQPQAQQPPPQPQRLTPAPRQPIITDEPMTDDEKRGWAARTKAMQLGSPELLDQANKLIEYGAGQRKEAYNAKLKDWQDQMLIQRQNQLEETKFARGAEQRNLEMAKTKAELTAQENANRLRAQFGNMDPAEAYKRLDASRDIAKGARQSMLASQEALHALDNGAITGIGANQRLDMAKLVTSLGLKDMGNEVQNTEVFRGAMQPIVANILHQTSGMSQLSEGELRFAAAAAAGNITLNASSMRELLRIIDTRSKEIINDHRTLTDALYGSEKNPQFHATWGVDVPPPKPGSTDAQALEWATQNANDPRAAAIKKKLGVR